MFDDAYDTEAPLVVSIRSELDIIAARIAARDHARRLGFSAVDQARIATATSELTRNMLAYAGEGSVMLQTIYQGTRCGIEIAFQDNGPGIADCARSTREQNGTSAHRRGLGLPGARLLMDELRIGANNGHGAIITCRKWLP